MPRFKVAHVHESGHDMVIILLNSEFEYQPPAAQTDLVTALQKRSTSAGLKGTVVPVWRSGETMSFIAPTKLHRYFRTLSFDMVRKKVNREIFW